MKTAISLPDELFEDAERLAKRLNKSRSEIYRSALEDYVNRHDSDQVREALDRALSRLGQAEDEFVETAAARLLERVEW